MIGIGKFKSDRFDLLDFYIRRDDKAVDHIHLTVGVQGTVEQATGGSAAVKGVAEAYGE